MYEETTTYTYIGTYMYIGTYVVIITQAHEYNYSFTLSHVYNIMRRLKLIHMYYSVLPSFTES